MGKGHRQWLGGRHADGVYTAPCRRSLDQQHLCRLVKRNFVKGTSGIRNPPQGRRQHHRNRRRNHAILDHPVDQPQIQRPARCHRRPGCHKVKRRQCAAKVRCADRSARSGQQAQGYLGKPQSGRGRGNPHPAAQGQFQAAAQGDTVNCGNGRKGQSGDPGDHLRQGRAGKLAQFSDVGSGHKRSLQPGQDHRYGSTDRHGRHDLCQFGPQSVRQGVYWRPVQAHDRHIAHHASCDPFRRCNDLIHANLPPPHDPISVQCRVSLFFQSANRKASPFLPHLQKTSGGG